MNVDCSQLTGRKRDLCRGYDDRGNLVRSAKSTEEWQAYFIRSGMLKGNWTLASCSTKALCRPNAKGRCRFCGHENRTGQEPCPAFTPTPVQAKEPSAKLIAQEARQKRKATLKPPYTYTMRNRKYKGLGDLMEAIFLRVGIKAAVEWVNAKLGSRCDCDRRKALLNNLVPFCTWGNRGCWKTARKEWGTLWASTRTRLFSRRKKKSAKPVKGSRPVKSTVKSQRPSPAPSAPTPNVSPSSSTTVPPANTSATRPGSTI